MSATVSGNTVAAEPALPRLRKLSAARPVLDRPMLAAMSLVLAVAVGCTPMLASSDLAADTTSVVTRLWVWPATLTWPVVVCLVVVSAVHYAAAAVAVRAAAGVALPFGELVAAQCAASGANRLTPAGLGGATVTGRYLVRRGRLQPAAAAAAMSTLMVLGALADLVAFAAVIGLGSLVGLPGASSEVPLLVNRVVGVLPVPAGWWLWAGVCAAASITAAALLFGRRASSTARRVIGGVKTYQVSLGVLVRQPRRLAVVMGASAGTTVVLAAGFAAVATMGSTGLPASTFCALMVGYMLAAAAGNALPTPGGIGTSDAAFVGVLVAAHMPATSALATVLIFRLLTFWAPAVLGLCLIRPLRHRGAL